jgi:hypothetical protein
LLRDAAAGAVRYRRGEARSRDQRNLLMAIALSIAILVVFQLLFPAPHRQPAPTRQPAEQSPNVPAPRLAGPEQPTRNRPAPPGGTPRVQIETPTLRGSINLVGARFDELELSRYHETVNPKSPEVVLLAPEGAPLPAFVDFGWHRPAAASRFRMRRRNGPRRARSSRRKHPSSSLGTRTPACGSRVGTASTFSDSGSGQGSGPSGHPPLRPSCEAALSRA